MAWLPYLILCCRLYIFLKIYFPFSRSFDTYSRIQLSEFNIYLLGEIKTMSVLTWAVENQVAVFGIAYAALNLLNGVLDLAKVEHGWLAKVRAVVDRLSVLTAKDGANTIKAPLSKSKK